MKTNIFYLISFLLLVLLSDLDAQNMYSDPGGGILYLKPMGGNGPAGVKRGSYVGPHLLGDTITGMINEFEKAYVYYKVTSGGYPVEEKVVLKKNIYKKVKEFDEFITKNYVDGLLEKTVAFERYKLVLLKSTKLMRYDTHQVEKEVKKLKTPEEFEDYIKKVRFQ